MAEQEDLPEERRAMRRAAEPQMTQKERTPLFEAPARGVVLSGSARTTPPPSRARCEDCGSLLPTGQRITAGTTLRCAECAADPG